MCILHMCILLLNIFRIYVTSLIAIQLYFNLMETNGRIYIYKKSLWAVIIFIAVNTNCFKGK